MTSGERAYIVAKTPDPRERLDLRLSPELRERIARQVERFSGGMSGYIRQAIIERLERDEATDPRGPEDSES